MLSASSPIAIYSALICLKKPLRKTKKCTLLMSFKYIFHSGQVIIRHPRGENGISWLFQFLLIIPRVPVNLAVIKCGRGLEKDFIIASLLFQGYSHTGATKSRGFVGDVGYVGTVGLWVSYVGLWVS